jgi:hypothetical protein
MLPQHAAAAPSSVRVGIVGRGCVGDALYAACRRRPGVCVRAYDVVLERTDTLSVRALAAISDIVFVALPTEPAPHAGEDGDGAGGDGRGDGSGGAAAGRPYDLRAIEAAMAELDRFPGPIVLKSTVAPGTTEALAARYGLAALFHSPEFVSQATARLDVARPLRPDLLLGVCPGVPAAQIDRCEALLAATVLPRGGRVAVATAAETELAKLACNAFYACKVRLFNAVHALCERVGGGGAHYAVVRDLVVRRGWVHPMHTYVPDPGSGQRGVGGRCLPKDVGALAAFAREVGAPSPLLEAVARARA